MKALKFENVFNFAAFRLSLGCYRDCSVNVPENRRLPLSEESIRTRLSLRLTIYNPRLYLTNVEASKFPTLYLFILVF